MKEMSMNKSRLNRRAFLGAIPAAAAAARPGSHDLAVDGGTPVRTERLNSAFPGLQFLDEQERGELTDAYDSHNLFRYYGPATAPQKVAKFEQEFGAYMGTRYVLGLTSGTASLHVGLVALGVGPGDEVILPTWTWHSCYTAILMTGALPVFAEVDESFTMDPDDLARKITPQTKVVMPVHLMGSPADMDRIMPLARSHGLKVLEDVAQSAGAKYKGKRLGSIGDAGIYSFQVHKLITAGEGGAVVTSDPQIYERATRFHDLGMLRPYHQKILGTPAMPYFVGVNYRMNEMTGAVMRGQLRKLDNILARHQRNARYVKDAIRSLPGIKLRHTHDAEGETGWTVDLLLPDRKTRDRFITAMSAENVPMTLPTAATPLPPSPYIENKCVPHPAWPTFNSPRGKAIQYGAQSCPRTMDIYGRAATLTIGPKYTEGDLKDIVAAITKVHRALLA
jgi:8-amino-3,8-dideoxy-alpha-D-manno-octulosonate transaminase